MSDTEQTIIRRSPGRPRLEQTQQTLSANPNIERDTVQQETSAPPKKGNPSWRPANTVDVINKEPGFRYRMIRKDDRNIAKKQAEGWEIISGINSHGTSAETGYGRINEGKKLSSVQEGFDYVIGRLPEELGKQRDAYFNGESERRVKAIHRDTKKDMKSDVHGSITIERKGVRTVIED